IDSLLSHANGEDLILLLGGPVLHRARELIISDTANHKDNHAIIPSELTPTYSDAHAQTIAHNPT
ncbi:MAG: hypothetical protein NUK65_00635, partial [Firmicutes bacterium]|nr:hypothetical protein [Bacillota bacterium]